MAVNAAEGSNINLSFHLFCKYEMSIHKNVDTDFADFLQFLVTSPLKVSFQSVYVFN